MSQLSLSAAGPRAVSRFEAAILRLERLAPDVTRLVMAPHADAKFSYRPGQYLSLLLAGGERRSFSMATPCGAGRLIELHIRHRPGGRFSDQMLAELKVGDLLSFEGPYGHGGWRDGPGPAILIGTGTGLAPLKALLEHGLTVGGRRPIHLYWGGRAPQDLYLARQLHQLSREHERLQFTPLLSRPHATWAGRRGYVQDAVAQDFAALHGAEIHACGSPAMIEAAHARLARLPGFDEARFMTDAFEPAASAIAPAGAPSLRLSVQARGRIRTVQAPTGVTLLSALQAAGAPILSICGGKASCGACKVTIDEAWRDRLPAPERTERRLLAYLDVVGPGDRLACQIRLTPAEDGLAVRLAPETTAAWPA